jgi:predicted O-linked N-acetylglucosamine transferase (SPINDLY family)
MPTSAEALTLAVQLQHAGRLQEAEHLCRQILQAEPAHAEALHLSGLLAHQRGQHKAALAYLRQALALKPAADSIHANLGMVYRSLGQKEDAAACYREALRLRPDLPQAHNNLGNVLREQGKLPEAVDSFRRALQLRPDFPEAHSNLGAALRELGRPDEAIACFQAALRLRPDHAPAYNNLGNALRELGRLDDAVASFREALRLRPDYPQAHNNLGSTYRDRGDWDEAVASFRQALRLRPDYADAYSNLGNMLQEQGDLEEAIRCYREGLRLQPDHAFAHSNLLFCLGNSERITPEEMLAEHRRWGDRHGNLAGPLPPHVNERIPGRRLRIGYVSPDFRSHAVMRFVEPILTHHDPAQVEVFCYPDGPIDDDVSRRLRALAHSWRPIYGLSDTQVAQQSRADCIDILVDLAGHTSNHRLRAFAHKPAPIQVTYLGHPYTTGLAAMDYRLTDAVLEPPGTPSYNTEELVRLLPGFCCFMPSLEAPEVNSLPALQNGHVTFGSMHRLSKLNAAVLDLWCRLLHAVPSSRLLVVRNTLVGAGRDRLIRELTHRGIPAERFELRHKLGPGRHSHLGIYADVDVLLDAFPWGAHTTACEALWLGVPVLTLYGDRAAGRMAASILSRLELDEWVARTQDEFVEQGARLTEDQGRLAELRAGLRERMRARMCDGKLFTSELENAYRQMWCRWCVRA